MFEARFVPIDTWPGVRRESSSRKRSPFRMSWTKTLDGLEYELRRLCAKDVIIQAYLRPEQIRNDGWLRAGCTPADPGVILTFTNKQNEEISFPCDTYKDYESNLRAIYLSLVALRAVDRYGVTRNNEQYRGWAKLPPAPKTMSKLDAARFISLHSGIAESDLIDRPVIVPVAIKRAQMKLHPDNTVTGSHEQFVLLQKAAEVIVR